MPLITLTDTQMAEAKKVALRRLNESTHFKDTFPTDPKNYYKIDLLGTVSEMAVATFLGLPWTGATKIKASDVAGFEVRSSQRKDGKDYWLYIREHDKDGIYIFCVVDGPNVVIAGWSTAYQVRSVGTLLYKDTNCYGLSRKSLYPMWQLQEVVEYAESKP
jgi:hypothetical protein